MAKEPQSYGSQADWVEGEVGETVNRQKGKPNSQHADFYESRRDSEESAPAQGGLVSDVELAENAEPQGEATDPHDTPSAKVTVQHSGAKRGGYFKDRDYK